MTERVRVRVRVRETNDNEGPPRTSTQLSDRESRLTCLRKERARRAEEEHGHIPALRAQQHGCVKCGVRHYPRILVPDCREPGPNCGLTSLARARLKETAHRRPAR